MVVAGMPAVCSSMSQHLWRIDVDLFLWVFQLSGVSIALIGWRREQWLQRRRR